MNGKPYYTRTYCVKSHTIIENNIHVGFDGIPLGNGLTYGEEEKIICDVYKTDTIEIKK